MGEIVDLGCGPKKIEGAVGVDSYPYPGVDVVVDLNITPWPLEDNRFDEINGFHIIEHVEDTVKFLSEIHRIGRAGARVKIVTPHFSSLNSWSDPTHIRHLSTTWYEPILAGGYLADRTGEFSLEYSKAKFGKSMNSWLPRVMTGLFGQSRWEKHYAFMFPAIDLETVLGIVK